MKHPTAHRVAISHSELVIHVDHGDTLLGGILRAGVGVPYECNAGGCGSCKYTLLDGSVADDLEETAGLRASDRRKSKHLACISRPQSDCTIELKLDPEYTPKNAPRKVDASLHSIEKLTHDLWEFHFDAPRTASFLPGQYAKVSLPGVTGPRSYSMSNVANEVGRWSFQIKRMEGGAASKVLFDGLTTDLQVTIDGPYSTAYLRSDSVRPIICIGGGSGLAPMVSILRGISQRKSDKTKPVLYYGARQEKDVVDQEYLATIPGFNPENQYIPIVSEPEESDTWAGATGLVHEFLKSHLNETTQDSDFYMAGPPPMVDAVRRHLVLDRGIPVDRLYYDRFF